VSDIRSIESLTAEDFRPYLGNSFRLLAGVTTSDDGGGTGLELVDVSEHSAGANTAFRTPFTVLFHGPLTPVRPQGIYRLAHERLGTIEIFIVPVGPADPAAPGAPGALSAAMRYEVVFG
jgi:hypothetical protein